MAVASLLPLLLPTPPRNTMLPLLPTPCLIILPVAAPPSMPKPGRADSVKRWDAQKKPAGSATPSSSTSSSGCPIRAASCERKEPGGPASSSATGSRGTIPGRADTCERWDMNKIKINPSTLTPPSSKQPTIRETQTEATMMVKQKPLAPPFSGPASSVAPDPSMLPIPAFFLAH